MTEEQPIIQEAIGYSFKGLYKFEYLEELINEFHLESNRYWTRPATEEDWFTKGDWVVLREEPNPALIDEYDLTYDIPYTDSTVNKVKFVEYLADTMLEYLGYLEACLEKEIDNKKEDTE